MTGEPESPAAVSADPLEGRIIGGKFEVEMLLGSGAMGSVYRARQIALDRHVAIKVMHRQLEQDAAYAARFDREAKAASRLDHPNLIRVLDFGREPDGLFYIAMEFLDGRDLFRVLEQDWPLSPARIIDVLSQTLAGLAAAHDAGILHRDLKPENIMLLRRKADDGASVDLVKVCDFGIAKMVNAPRGEIAPGQTRARNLSTAGFVVGTPEFMSPEQAHGLDLDGRADVYSVGVILYQLLTSRLPFEAPTPLGVVLKVLHEDAPRPSEIAKTLVNPDLEAICMKAMQKDPKARFADAREMRAALLRIAHEAGYVPAPRVSRSSIANAPTLDFVPSPPVSQDDATRQPRASSLDPQEVPKPVKKGIASVALIAASALALLFAFRGRLIPQREAAATNEAPTTTVATATSSLAPEAIATTPIADPPQIQPDSRSHGPLAKHRHEFAAAHKNSIAPDQPDPPPAIHDPPPPPPTSPTETPAQPLPTSPPVLTAPPPVPTTPVATAPSFDAATAHVDLGTPKASGTTPLSVSRALALAAPKITACYRAGLTAANAGATAASLHVGTDEDGFITDARVSGLPFVTGECIANEVRGRKILNVDTGNAVADVPLALKPR
ncbi:MAG: serine/threonine-protein kinase [Polyangiaceae bacterium]